MPGDGVCQLLQRRLERRCGRHGAGWLARTRPQDTRIAAIFPDGPQRYFDTVYNDEFCEAKGLTISGPPVHEPDEIDRPDAVEVHRWTRCTTVLAPTGPEN